MPNKRLREDLFRKNLLLAVVPIFCIGVSIIFMLSKHIYNDVEDENNILVKMIAGEIQSFFDRPKALIFHYRDSWETGKINDNENSNRIYERELNIFKSFESVYFVDKKGIILNAFFPDKINANRRDYIGLDIRNLLKKNAGGSGLEWSDTFVSPVTGEPTIMISTETAKGTIVANINFKSLKEIIDRVASFSKAEAFVTNRNGFLIAHENYDLVLQQYNYSTMPVIHNGMQGKARSVSFSHNGKEYLGSSFLLQEMGWVVCCMQEKNLFLRPLLNLIVVITAVMVIAITFGLFIAGRIVRRITTPAGALISDIHNAADGKYNLEAKDFDYYEIQELSEHFIKMADTVSEREALLNAACHDLKQSEEKFRQLAENMHEVFWVREYVSRKIIYVSPSYEKLWGRNIARVYEDADYFLGNIYSEDVERLAVSIKNQYAHHAEFNEEFRVVREDGEVRWVWARSYFVRNGEGEIYRIVGVGDDITDKKMLETLMVDSIREKETLLKEIHHRVKNNLQIISSLLQMQSLASTDENVSTVIESAVNRITSMALIHDKLYKSENLSSINARRYIEDLCFRLRDNCAYEKNITLQIEVMDVAFSIDVMIPIGLILNELLTNSFKYAFNESTGEPLIQINLQCTDTGTTEFAYVDNGVGIPDGIHFDNTKSLGLPLVYNLSRQIGGEVGMVKGSGAHFIITFQSSFCSIVRDKRPLSSQA